MRVVLFMMMPALIGSSVAAAAVVGGQAPAAGPMRATYDATAGLATVTEAGRPVLQYHYKTVPIPHHFFDDIPAAHLPYARKYAQPRSDYIHPLFGLDGQALTADWQTDHPHHRGIYWAWPEVMYQGVKADLHALQIVFARPTGQIDCRQGENWAEIRAVNRWMWQDKTPVVREIATIRAWRAEANGRSIDLALRFEPLVEGVTLARRGTNKYGGLNIRMAKIAQMKLTHFADPPDALRRRAWQAASGRWAGSDRPAILAVFEKTTNPCYPGDYIQFAYLPWFQPTFPRAGERYVLKKNQPLVLQYRLWIGRGSADADVLARQWRRYNPDPRSSNRDTP